MINILVFCLVTLSVFANPNNKIHLNVGSKKFTESIILGELARVSLEHEGFVAVHKKELGGTRILWNALLSGDIDVYADYTGTLEQEILQTGQLGFDELLSQLAKYGIGATKSIGFNNTYAVGMTRERAESLSIKKISDLIGHPKLRMGWGEEFRLRRDGWIGLKKFYNLPHKVLRGIDHDIAYRALHAGDIDIMDMYSTDAEIDYYDLIVIADDKKFFPKYEALYLYRLDRANQSPSFYHALRRLENKVNELQMIKMNREAKIEKIPTGTIATNFMNQTFHWDSVYRSVTRTERVITRTKEHFYLVFISLLAAIVTAIPLGVLACRNVWLGRGILWFIGTIQTVPALALLVILIYPLNWFGFSGIGDTPALIALYLYSLLPIVRSTYAGLESIPKSLHDISCLLNLNRRIRLWKIELPIALPFILSGVTTAAVMNVGFATLGALVGAGGYGQPILTGIRLDDYGLILEGAIPSAALAVVIQQLFEIFGAKVISPGLK